MSLLKYNTGSLLPRDDLLNARYCTTLIWQMTFNSTMSLCTNASHNSFRLLCTHENSERNLRLCLLTGMDKPPGCYDREMFVSLLTDKYFIDVCIFLMCNINHWWRLPRYSLHWKIRVNDKLWLEFKWRIKILSTLPNMNWTLWWDLRMYIAGVIKNSSTLSVNWQL